ARAAGADRRAIAWARAGRRPGARARGLRPSSSLPRMNRLRRLGASAHDAHDLLVLLPDAELRGVDEAVDDVRVVLDAVVDELRLGVAKNEERRRLAQHHGGGKAHERSPPIVEHL